MFCHNGWLCLFIYGLLACHNAKYLFSDKPKTVTFDAEIFLGEDDESTMCVMMAVLHYFVPIDKPIPTEGHVYLVGGRLASVTDKTPIGEGYNSSAYDVEIFVCIHFYLYFRYISYIVLLSKLHQIPSSVDPAHPMVTISGPVSVHFLSSLWMLTLLQSVRKISDREFNIDISLSVFSLGMVYDSRLKY